MQEEHSSVTETISSNSRLRPSYFCSSSDHENIRLLLRVRLSQCFWIGEILHTAGTNESPHLSSSDLHLPSSNVFAFQPPLRLSHGFSQLVRGLVKLYTLHWVKTCLQLHLPGGNRQTQKPKILETSHYWILSSLTYLPFSFLLFKGFNECSDLPFFCKCFVFVQSYVLE